MQVMALTQTGRVDANATPLELQTREIPVPQDDMVRLRVTACGVCHTELDEIEGRLETARLPVVLGHEVVGIVDARGTRVTEYAEGERVGVGWFFSSCGRCEYCKSGRENLCTEFRATGCDVDGGYAEYMLAPQSAIYRIPDAFSNEEAAPLLCAGGVGYRSLRLAAISNGQILGLTGFGASGHLVLQTARTLYPETPVFVFARSEVQQQQARELGAAWAGHTQDAPPEAIHTIIDTTPAWTPVVAALRNLRPGGRLVINAIRKQDGDKNALLELGYHTHLWNEREVKSVANITPADIADFLPVAASIPLRPEIETYPLTEANQALRDLKAGNSRGARVLVMS